MIALYALRADSRAKEIRDELLKQSIPCILIGPEYGNASVISRVPFVFFGEGCESFSSGFRNSIPAIRILSSYDALSADSLIERLQVVYGIDYRNFSSGGIRFVNDQLYFFGNRIFLTENEQRILKLLTVSRGNYFTADEIAAFCLERGGAPAASVHICHINAKNKANITDKLIQSKRYRGYIIQ